MNRNRYLLSTECPHCRTRGDHVLVPAPEGEIAWCQTCFCVHAIPPAEVGMIESPTERRSPMPRRSEGPRSPFFVSTG